MVKKRKLAIGAIVFAAVFFLAYRFFLSPQKLYEIEAFGIMDTDVSIKAYGRNAESALDEAIWEMKRIDQLFSAFSPDSYVSKINEAAGIAPVEVPPEVFSVIERAVYFSEITGGSFDPTILPVMTLWGFGTAKKSKPSREKLLKTMELVDYRKIELDFEKSTVYLKKAGMGLDLGAIVKGYAVDKMHDVLKARGIESFLINAGGNVYAGGKKPDGTLWRVAVTDPLDPSGYLGVIEAQDISLVSSGDYQRYFEEGGVRYHHIIDPGTGYPASVCVGTTVILPSSKDADALSTSFFVLGPDRSADLAKLFPGIGVIFVETGGNVATYGIVDNFQFK